MILCMEKRKNEGIATKYLKASPGILHFTPQSDVLNVNSKETMKNRFAINQGK